LAACWHELDAGLVEVLLSERTWRARLAGGYLVALARLGALEPHVSGLLLRSETPYAGRAFCLALARLGGASSVKTLKRYLDIYLVREDLIYDQCGALGALSVLDPSEALQYYPAWERYAATKPEMTVEFVVASFAAQLSEVETLGSLLENR
jgi:hypothetical protein